MTRPIVHFIWIGSPLPQKYAMNILSYSKQFDIRVWTQPLDNMVNRDIYDRMHSFAGKADILRLEILYNFGGLYTDVDSRLLRELPLDNDLITMTTPNGFVGNETIYATQHHPAIGEAIERLRSNVMGCKNRQVNIWDIAGATYLTPIINKYEHKQYPYSIIGSDKRSNHKSIIAHSYDGSWTKRNRRARSLPKAQKRPLSYWMNTRGL